MFKNFFANFFTTNIGIDLGTINTIIFIQNRGIVLSEPSIMSISNYFDEMLIIGNPAKKMIGRAPDFVDIINPFQNGTVDIEVIEKILEYFIEKAIGSRGLKSIFYSPKILIAIPANINKIEIRVLKESIIKKIKANNVIFVDESIAAAVGVGLPINEPIGSMIINLGGDISEIAIISLSHIVESLTTKIISGNKLDSCIIQYLQKTHNIFINIDTAEQLKKEIGIEIITNIEENEKNIDYSLDIKGIDIKTELPKIINIMASEISKTLSNTLINIIEPIKQILKTCSPELASDLLDRGIILTGGGALLKGIDQFISNNIGLKVSISENPLHDTINGTKIIIKNIDKMNDLLKFIE